MWLQSKTERRFKNEFVTVGSMDHLVALCFGDGVIGFYHLIKVLSGITFIVTFNMFLGYETDQMLCHYINGYTCGKYEHLIPLGFNLVIAPIVLAMSSSHRTVISILKSLRHVRLLVFAMFLTAIALIVYHELTLLRGEPEKYKYEQLEKAAKVTSGMPAKDFFRITSSYVCIAMCLFDGSSKTLRIKNKMDNPRNFTKAAFMSNLVYAVIVFSFSVLAYLAFGQDL